MNRIRAAGSRKAVPPRTVVFKNSFKGFSPVRFGLERSKIRETFVLLHVAYLPVSKLWAAPGGVFRCCSRCSPAKAAASPLLSAGRAHLHFALSTHRPFVALN